MRRDRQSLAVVTACGESSALHFLGGEGPVTVLVLHANGFCGRMYEPLVARTSLSSLATVYALDMPGQGSSPPRKRKEEKQQEEGALASYGALALAAVDWLRRNGKLSPSSPLCALGHSGGGLAAIRAEQGRPGTFRALYLYEPVVLTAIPPSSENESSPSSSPPFGLSSTPSLVASARRRRREFASREAAAASLRKKPPMSLFDDECLRIYTEEGMVLVGEEKGGGRGGGGREEAGLSSPSSSFSTTTSTSPSSSPSTSLVRDAAAFVTLAASPEDEAAVYLEAGPLGVEAGKKLELVAAPVLVAAGGGSGGSGGGGGGGRERGGGSETADDDKKTNLHEPLARAAPRTARLLRRGKLEVYRGLGHLGPFEDPVFVGERAAEAFRRALSVDVDVDVDGGGGGGGGGGRSNGGGNDCCCCCSWCRKSSSDSNSWDSLPDKAELISTRARSKL